MERLQKMTHKAHCLILPYPIQGHINPMLQFSKRLQSKGVKITVAATKSLLKTMQELSTSVSVEAISDGYDEGGREQAGSFTAYITRFKEVGSDTLSQLIQKLTNLGCRVNCIVYDPFLPWAVEVAKKHGLSCAAFFTQSCAVDSIYYHVHKGVVKLPPTEVDEEVLIPGLPTFATSDVPNFASSPESARILEMLMNQFSNLEKADWVLINCFYELEKEIIDWMAKIYPIRTIGPTIPSMYVDKRLSDDDKEYGLSVFKPMTNACLNWLNNQPVSSVVYVSFGSLAKLEPEQMEELAWGLKMSNKNFLWVVRSTEESKLPNNFLEELTNDKGLVVSWCPQLQVLEHKSIGCFLTHCGWNSNLEAISLGVPMVTMPQWSDQPTNSKLVKDVWEIGVRAKQDEKGIVRRDVIEECIKLVMEEEKGERIRENANKWKELARKAVDEGGSSDRNIEEFVSKLVTVPSLRS